MINIEIANGRKRTNLIKKHIKSLGAVEVSVRSESFSMGSSIDISYSAWKRIPEVEAFIHSLKYGHFDIMTDCYESSNRKDIIIDGYKLNQSKYVFCEFNQVDEYIDFEKELAEPEKETIKFTKEINVEIVEYSEKSIAVVGDTKEVKQILKNIGGRFNPKLKCGAGWIFSVNRKDEIIKALSMPN